MNFRDRLCVHLDEADEYGIWHRDATDADLARAGFVPAAMLERERETSRRLSAALARVKAFIDREWGSWPTTWGLDAAPNKDATKGANE